MTKNQHYVPRFYLSRFLNRNNEAEVLDWKRRDIVTPRGPKGICCEAFYYGIETGKQDEVSQKVEQAFQAMEDCIAKVIPEFIDDIANRRKISPAQKWNIAALMSMLWTRGPVMRSTVNSMLEGFTKQAIVHMCTGDVGEDIVHQADETSDAKSSSDMRESIKNIMCDGEFSLRFDNQPHMGMFSDISKYANLFSSQHWTVHIANTSNKFVTSDNPVATYIPSREGWYGGTFLERVHYFSLSPDICIEARYASHKAGKHLVRNTLFEDDNDVVLKLNLQISNKAHQYTYAQDRGCLEDILMFVQAVENGTCLRPEEE